MVAWPAALVLTVAPPGKVTPAPGRGPPNVTLAPLIGLPYRSVTFATRELLNAMFTVAPCPPPDTAVITAAGAGLTVMLVEPVAVGRAVSTTVRVRPPADFRTTLWNVWTLFSDAR